MFEDNFIVVDLETTGLSPINNEIIEIGAIKVKNNEIVDTMDIFVKCEKPVNRFITSLTGITNNMLKDAPCCHDGIKMFLDFANDSTLVAHNAKFDMGFLNNYSNIHFNKGITNKCLDTLTMSRSMITDIPNYKLETLASYFKIDYNGAHRSLADCHITLKLYNELYRLSKNRS